MPANKPRRPTRDSESGRRLDTIRGVMKRRREQAKRREAATIDAISTYLRAAEEIRHCQALRDQRIGELRRRIEQLEREHEDELARWRGEQAGAVTTMRSLGESDKEIGELLDLPGKQIRQLIALGRAAGAQTVEANQRLSELGSAPDVRSESEHRGHQPAEAVAGPEPDSGAPQRSA